jgi:hypothetical protein
MGNKEIAAHTIAVVIIVLIICFILYKLSGHKKEGLFFGDVEDSGSVVVPSYKEQPVAAEPPMLDQKYMYKHVETKPMVMPEEWQSAKIGTDSSCHCTKTVMNCNYVEDFKAGASPLSAVASTFAPRGDRSDDQLVYENLQNQETAKQWRLKSWDEVLVDEQVDPSIKSEHARYMDDHAAQMIRPHASFMRLEDSSDVIQLGLRRHNWAHLLQPSFTSRISQSQDGASLPFYDNILRQAPPLLPLM